MLRYWNQSTAGLTVQHVIDRVKKWLNEDMIDRHVWTSVQNLVDLDLPQLPPTQVPEPAEGSKDVTEESECAARPNVYTKTDSVIFYSVPNI